MMNYHRFLDTPLALRDVAAQELLVNIRHQLIVDGELNLLEGPAPQTEAKISVAAVARLRHHRQRRGGAGVGRLGARRFRRLRRDQLRRLVQRAWRCPGRPRG